MAAGYKWALVTGASSGLGVEFARQLAAQGSNVVLTARTTEPMETLATELRRNYGVEVLVETGDLSLAGSAQSLVARLDARSIEIDCLVNNAGFGMNGRFLDQDLSRITAMLQLDVVSLTELTHLYGRRMAKVGRGHILLVGSMAAYQPIAGYASYAAAKAYVLSLGEALHVELAPAVTVTVLSPGFMDTGFNAVANYETPANLKAMEMTPRAVARIGLEALYAGRSGVIAGKLNKIMAFSSRLMPRHTAARLGDTAKGKS